MKRQTKNFTPPPLPPLDDLMGMASTVFDVLASARDRFVGSGNKSDDAWRTDIDTALNDVRAMVGAARMAQIALDKRLTVIEEHLKITKKPVAPKTAAKKPTKRKGAA